jgi:hypothetical protein
LIDIGNEKVFLRLEPTRIVGKLPERIKRYSYKKISKFIENEVLCTPWNLS